MQLVQEKKYSLRYKCGIWSYVEKKYDVTKQEFFYVMKILKKVRYWLYGIRFVLETDANVLVAQLNWLGTNLSGVPVN